MDTIVLVAERNRWETPELEAEVRDILDAIEAPPADAEVMSTFQKILYRRKYFDYDARGQIILTCRCILESEGNEGAFAEPFVSAVHSACSNKEFADRGLELVEAFDQIDLVGILKTMRALEYFRLNDVRSVVGQIVRNKLRRILSPPPPLPESPRPSKKERLEADKQATAAANRRVVERKIELGRKLAALRDTMSNNRRFGAAVRKQFGLDDALSVAEMMRVARLYGERPEIFRDASWHALTELASSATSEAERQRFEAKISTGERVSGAEIVRAAPLVKSRSQSRSKPSRMPMR
jgi:hypothetical protein